jgi:putative membrane protein
MKPDARLPLFLLFVGLGVLIWSGITPYDRLTWLLETFPAMIGAVVLVATYRRFRFSNLVYALILIHAIILMLGGHWTYAEMPLFNWIRDMFHLARNYYDRVGHLAQGFVPAIIARELLLRTSSLQRGKWLSTIVICICLSISVGYEFIEWWSSLLLHQSADAFLGTQGDVWDTQWDMFMCWVGAILALLTMRGLHDRSMAKLRSEK